MRLVASVSELGLFSGLAKSRLRLVIASLFSFGLAFLYAGRISAFVLEESSSLGANILLITGQFFLVLIAAYLHAMLAGTLIFGEIWRERVLVGGAATPRDHEEEEDEEVLGLERFRDNTIPFYGLFALLVLGNYLALSATQGDIVAEYSQRGHHLTMMRAEAPEVRIAALQSLVDPWLRNRAGNDPALRTRVVTLIGDPDPEVRAWAAWAAGHLEIAGAHGALVAALDDEQDVVRIEAAEAAGRLQMRGLEAERRLLRMLPASIGEEALTRAILHGLGHMHSSDAIDPVLSLIGILPERIEPVAWWVIWRADSTAAREATWARWDEVEEPVLRCSVAEALKSVTTVEDLPRLYALFESLERGEHCDELIWQGRSYDPDERLRPITYIVGEELRIKLLKAIFNIAGPGLREWLQAVAWDSDESTEMRVLADQLADLLRRSPSRVPREGGGP